MLTESRRAELAELLDEGGGDAAIAGELYTAYVLTLQRLDALLAAVLSEDDANRDRILSRARLMLDLGGPVMTFLHVYGERPGATVYDATPPDPRTP